MHAIPSPTAAVASIPILAEETLLEGTQRHLAQDAGRTVDNETLTPKAELQVTAQGVLVEKT